MLGAEQQTGLAGPARASGGRSLPARDHSRRARRGSGAPEYAAPPGRARGGGAAVLSLQRLSIPARNLWRGHCPHLRRTLRRRLAAPQIWWVWEITGQARATLLRQSRSAATPASESHMVFFWNPLSCTDHWPRDARRSVIMPNPISAMTCSPTWP